LADVCELTVVTERPQPETRGVRVYNGLGPNDPQLLSLYRDADIFALPTFADCRAVVLSEAMAAGLPVVTTSVGAQPEAVGSGVTGLIVPPNDSEALGRALRRLIDEPELRLSMGRHARAIAEARFDARINARELTDVITRAIDRWQTARECGRNSEASAL
jgi:glycosyltransferase involved in cell wall biosynthesis